MNTLKVTKTIKLFLGGQFPRTESGRSFPLLLKDQKGVYAQVCQGSRKDVRKGVECAKGAFPGWSGKSAFLRGQILYRMAEMLQGKSSEFVDVLTCANGLSKEEAQQDVETAIDGLVYYAGFADKYAQVLSSLNPVSGPFHNFTAPQAVGVVGWIQRDSTFQLGQFVTSIAGLLCPGNSVVALLNPQASGVLAALGEVFATSDLPGGVVNLISGFEEELAPHLASHMEVQSLAVSGGDGAALADYQRASVDNMKRFVNCEALSPLDRIAQFTEAKTVWHTIGL